MSIPARLTTALLVGMLLLSACSSPGTQEPAQTQERMEQRLEQLMHPDSLIAPRPEHASLTSGRRVARDAYLNEAPGNLHSDDYFFTWTRDVDKAGSPEVFYTEFARVVNGVTVGRSGSSRVDGRLVQVVDTMPDWVRLEFAVFQPVVEATGMQVREWEASVHPNWLPDLTGDWQGRSTVSVRLGSAVKPALDGPGDGVFLALKELGEVVGAHGEFDDVIFIPESENSGSFRYEIGDRSLRYHIAAGPTIGESLVTFTIEELHNSGS